MSNSIIKYQERFQVYGYFYLMEYEKYRKQLDIKSANCIKQIPDIIFVMMNPGSSKQADGYQNSYNKLVPAIHDKTQEKIMNLMELVNFQFARIINLSDYCNKDSFEFYKKISSLERMFPLHSIFHIDRRKELKNLIPMKAPIILAWGVHQNLNVLSKQALDFLMNRTSLYGLQHKQNSNGYYHPLRRVSKVHELSWLEEIKNEFFN